MRHRRGSAINNLRRRNFSQPHDYRPRNSGPRNSESNQHRCKNLETREIGNLNSIYDNIQSDGNKNVIENRNPDSLSCGPLDRTQAIQDRNNNLNNSGYDHVYVNDRHSQSPHMYSENVESTEASWTSKVDQVNNNSHSVHSQQHSDCVDLPALASICDPINIPWCNVPTTRAEISLAQPYFERIPVDNMNYSQTGHSQDVVVPYMSGPSPPPPEEINLPTDSLNNSLQYDVSMVKAWQFNPFKLPFQQLNQQAPCFQQFNQQALPFRQQINQQALSVQQINQQAPPFQQLNQQAPPFQQLNQQTPPFQQQINQQAFSVQQINQQAPSFQQLNQQTPPFQQLNQQTPPFQEQINQQAPTFQQLINQQAPPFQQQINQQALSVQKINHQASPFPQISQETPPTQQLVGGIPTALASTTPSWQTPVQSTSARICNDSPPLETELDESSIPVLFYPPTSSSRPCPDSIGTSKEEEYEHIKSLLNNPTPLRLTGPSINAYKENLVHLSKQVLLDDTHSQYGQRRHFNRHGHIINYSKESGKPNNGSLIDANGNAVTISNTTPMSSVVYVTHVSENEQACRKLQEAFNQSFKETITQYNSQRTCLNDLNKSSFVNSSEQLPRVKSEQNSSQIYQNSYESNQKSSNQAYRETNEHNYCRSSNFNESYKNSNKRSSHQPPRETSEHKMPQGTGNHNGTEMGQSNLLSGEYKLHQSSQNENVNNYKTDHNKSSSYQLLQNSSEVEPYNTQRFINFDELNRNSCVNMSKLGRHYKGLSPYRGSPRPKRGRPRLNRGHPRTKKMSTLSSNEVHNSKNFDKYEKNLPSLEQFQQQTSSGMHEFSSNVAALKQSLLKQPVFPDVPSEFLVDRTFQAAEKAFAVANQVYEAEEVITLVDRGVNNERTFNANSSGNKGYISQEGVCETSSKVRDKSPFYRPWESICVSERTVGSVESNSERQYSNGLNRRDKVLFKKKKPKQVRVKKCTLGPRLKPRQKSASIKNNLSPHLKPKRVEISYIGNEILMSDNKRKGVFSGRNIEINSDKVMQKPVQSSCSSTVSSTTSGISNDPTSQIQMKDKKKLHFVKEICAATSSTDIEGSSPSTHIDSSSPPTCIDSSSSSIDMDSSKPRGDRKACNSSNNSRKVVLPLVPSFSTISIVNAGMSKVVPQDSEENKLITSNSKDAKSGMKLEESSLQNSDTIHIPHPLTLSASNFDTHGKFGKTAKPPRKVVCVAPMVNENVNDKKKDTLNTEIDFNFTNVELISDAGNCSCTSEVVSTEEINVKTKSSNVELSDQEKLHPKLRHKWSSTCTVSSVLDVTVNDKTEKGHAVKFPKSCRSAAAKSMLNKTYLGALTEKESLGLSNLPYWTRRGKFVMSSPNSYKLKSPNKQLVKKLTSFKTENVDKLRGETLKKAMISAKNYLHDRAKAAQALTRNKTNFVQPQKKGTKTNVMETNANSNCTDTVTFSGIGQAPIDNVSNERTEDDETAPNIELSLIGTTNNDRKRKEAEPRDPNNNVDTSPSKNKTKKAKKCESSMSSLKHETIKPNIGADVVRKTKVCGTKKASISPEMNVGPIVTDNPARNDRNVELSQLGPCQLAQSISGSQDMATTIYRPNASAFTLDNNSIHDQNDRSKLELKGLSNEQDNVFTGLVETDGHRTNIFEAILGDRNNINLASESGTEVDTSEDIDKVPVELTTFSTNSDRMSASLTVPIEAISNTEELQMHKIYLQSKCHILTSMTCTPELDGAVPILPELLPPIIPCPQPGFDLNTQPNPTQPVALNPSPLHQLVTEHKSSYSPTLEDFESYRMDQMQRTGSLTPSQTDQECIPCETPISQEIPSSTSTSTPNLNNICLDNEEPSESTSKIVWNNSDCPKIVSVESLNFEYTLESCTATENVTEQDNSLIEFTNDFPCTPKEIFDEIVDDILKDDDFINIINLNSSEENGEEKEIEKLNENSNDNNSLKDISFAEATSEKTSSNVQKKESPSSLNSEFKSSRSSSRYSLRCPRYQKKFPGRLGKSIDKEKDLYKSAEEFLGNFDHSSKRSCRGAAKESVALINPVTGRMELVDDTSDTTKEKAAKPVIPTPQMIKTCEYNKNVRSIKPRPQIISASYREIEAFKDKSEVGSKKPGQKETVVRELFNENRSKGGKVGLKRKRTLSTESQADKKVLRLLLHPVITQKMDNANRLKNDSKVKWKKVLPKVTPSSDDRETKKFNETCSTVDGAYMSSERHKTSTEDDSTFETSKMNKTSANIHGTCTTRETHKTVAKFDGTCDSPLSTVYKAPYACEVCEYPCETAMAQQLHFNFYHSLWCLKCAKMCIDEDARNQHMRQAHNIVTSCKVCMINFTYMWKYRLHLESSVHAENFEKLKLVNMDNLFSIQMCDQVCVISDSDDLAEEDVSDKLPETKSSTDKSLEIKHSSGEFPEITVVEKTLDKPMLGSVSEGHKPAKILTVKKKVGRPKLGSDRKGHKNKSLETPIVEKKVDRPKLRSDIMGSKSAEFPVVKKKVGRPKLVTGSKRQESKPAEIPMVGKKLCSLEMGTDSMGYKCKSSVMVEKKLGRPKLGTDSMGYKNKSSEIQMVRMKLGRPPKYGNNSNGYKLMTAEKLGVKRSSDSKGFKQKMVEKIKLKINNSCGKSCSDFSKRQNATVAENSHSESKNDFGQKGEKRKLDTDKLDVGQKKERKLHFCEVCDKFYKKFGKHLRTVKHITKTLQTCGVK